MTDQTMEVKPYLDLYESQKRTCKEPAWLSGLRDRAMQSFAETGFPTIRQATWRYTDLNPIRETRFSTAGSLSEPSVPGQGKESKTKPGHALFFTNGEYDSSISSAPAGVDVLRIQDALNREPALLKESWGQISDTKNPFVALNTAFSTQGVVIIVESGKVIQDPIHLVFSVTAKEGPAVFYPRILLCAKERSQATFVETYQTESAASYLTNAVFEIDLKAEARLKILKIQTENLSAFHVTHRSVVQKAGSSFSLTTLALGAKLMRDESRVRFDGEGAEAILSGLYLAESNQVLDHHVFVDHEKPSCQSRQIFKGILAGQSRGVFSGKVLVRKNAQHTDARQTNKNLLLSDDAKVDTEPQLEILADDVKCSHGAAIGQLDEDSLFYLRSRGIGEKQARRILAEGFAKELIEASVDGALRETWLRLVNEKLERQLGKEEAKA